MLAESGWRLAIVGLAFCVIGCKFISGPERQLPLPSGATPEQVIDADDPAESVTPLRPDDLARVGKLIQAERQKKVLEGPPKPGETPPKKYNILACSGGAVYGAYSAGVLCGWSESGLSPEKGGRPSFDVVTGISTGALIAPFAFLGPQYDATIRTMYTTLKTSDLYVNHRTLRQIFAESFVDNTKFRERIAQTLTKEIIAEIAAEHEKGRRLYVGTTNLDTKRINLWDIGAMAKRATPDSDRLIRDVITASASIPGFFPPVKIQVTIDGRSYEELHVDGAISRSLFFRSPYFNPSEREAVGPDSLADSNLYILVAGKINPAPAAVKVRTLPLALESTSMLLYSITRGDLYRMYTYCLLTGMNMRVAAIPDDEKVPAKSTEIDPVEATAMFESGFRYGKIGDITRTVPRTTPAGAKVETEETREGTAWRDLPPGLKNGENQGARTGRKLTLRPREELENGAGRGPEAPKSRTVPAPAIK